MESVEKLKKIIEYSSKRIKYYTQTIKDSSINNYSDFIQIPVISKDIVRENYNLFIYQENVQDLKYEYTSGTSGKPIKIARNKKDRFQSSFSQIKERKKWVRSSSQLGKRAIFSARLTEPYLYNERLEWLEFSLKNLSEDRVASQVDSLVSYRINMIQGPAQALVKLAEYIISKQIKIETVAFIENRSEFLHQGQKKVIEEAFNCKVANFYAAHECWGIAYDCKFNNLHIMEDNVFLEIVDDAFNPVNDGINGNVLITTLNSYAMPFIRYKLGDIAKIKPIICRCGNSSPIIELSNYRSSDWIYTVDGKTAPSVLRKLFVHLSNIELGIVQFQLVQLDYDKFLINLMCIESKIDDATIHFVKKEILENLGEQSNIELRINQDFYIKESGKFSWFINLMSF